VGTKLPSKKFIVILVFTVVVGTGVFLLLDVFKKDVVFVQNGNERFSFNTTSVKDSDEDGLRDWEEQILGTNPFESDLENIQIPTTETPGTANLTEAFSREIITSLLFTEEAALDEENVAHALDALFSDATTYEIPRIYTEKTARVVNNTEAAFKVYGNTFIRTIAKHSSANADNTLGTFEHILKTRDEKVTETLNSISEEYSKLESDLLSISVPREITSLHIDFINGIHALSQAVSDMGMVLQDPLRGTMGLNVYLKQLDSAWNILANIQKVFQKENVIFNEGEDGYVWILFQL